MSRQKSMPKHAICTKYLPPTNVRGSRIRAIAGNGKSVSVHYAHELGTFENHEEAAYALCKKLGWTGQLIGGAVRHGYCFVFKR